MTETKEITDAVQRANAETRDLLIVEIAGRHFGIEAKLVSELLRAAAIVPLANAPEIEGLLNLRGSVVPVFDLRSRLRLSPKPIEPSDHFVAITIASRRVVVRVDRIIDLVLVGPDEMENSALGLTGADGVLQVARRPGELLPILDLEGMLSHPVSTDLNTTGGTAERDGRTEAPT